MLLTDNEKAFHGKRTAQVADLLLASCVALILALGLMRKSTARVCSISTR